MLSFINEAYKWAYAKKEDEELIYRLFINKYREIILKEIKAIAHRPISIKNACEIFGMDFISFLIFLGYLRKMGLIRDVKII